MYQLFVRENILTCFDGLSKFGTSQKSEETIASIPVFGTIEKQCAIQDLDDLPKTNNPKETKR